MSLDVPPDEFLTMKLRKNIKKTLRIMYQDKKSKLQDTAEGQITVYLHEILTIFSYTNL